jgi:hypothetical protein
MLQVASIKHVHQYSFLWVIEDAGPGKSGPIEIIGNIHDNPAMLKQEYKEGRPHSKEADRKAAMEEGFER